MFITRSLPRITLEVMATLIATDRGPGTETIISGTDYQVVLTTGDRDIEAVQRLRYAVFSTEPGFEASMATITDGRDIDRFDDYCDHLLVRHLPTDTIVGCYRMLPPTGAIAAGGLYLATEFDLRGLDPIRAETFEMGRACVHPAHRSGTVVCLMWAGLLAYGDRRGLRYAVGATSVPMQIPGQERGACVRRVAAVVGAGHTAPWTVTPYVPVRGIGDVAPGNRRSIPPLMSGYLRMNAQVLGEPGFDPDFDVADFPTVLDRTRANVRYLDRLLAAVA